MNRSAVKLDMRASEDMNRSAVKSDLRSGGANTSGLAPTYEKSEEGSSDNDDDPFKSVLAPNAAASHEERKIAASAITVEEKK